jgi:uncharacterized protein (UPF0276 family)
MPSQRPAVGLGLRDPYVPPLLALRDRGALDVLEVMIDDARLDPHRMDAWRTLGARWPLIAHGVSLGIGDALGLDDDYVRATARDLRAIGARWYSEHLCFLRAGPRDAPVDLGHFAPLCMDEPDLDVLCANARALRARFDGTFLLENPADVLSPHGPGDAAARESARGFAAALRACDAGALLDLTNLALQARNDRFDPEVFLAELDWERVIQVHLAGGRRAPGGLWIDSHDHPVDPQAWDLLAIVSRRAPNLRAVILERDDQLPPLDALLAEVDRARSLLR